MIMRPLTAAALLAALQGASAGTSTFVTTMCTNITPSVWRKAACWTPSPPTEADTVVIPAGPPVFMNTTWDVDSKWNYTYVEALVAGGLTVNHGARLVLLQGSIELRGSASIQGLLELKAPHDGEETQARNTLNKDDLQKDGASRELGLRDCAYTPIGFTPRLCGAGTYVVEAGGELSVSGLYASVFSRVQVKTGGTYKLADRAHPFGLVQNEGVFGATSVYWHGLLENKAGGEATLGGQTFFDEYSHAGLGNDSKPEQFSQDPFINDGTLTVSGNVMSTRYAYKWDGGYHGEYISAFVNNGHMTVTGNVRSSTHSNKGSLKITGYGHMETGNVTSSGTVTVEKYGILNAAGFDNSGALKSSSTVFLSSLSSTATVELVSGSDTVVRGPVSNAKAATWSAAGVASLGTTTNDGTWTVNQGSCRTGDFVNNGKLTIGKVPWSSAKFENVADLEITNGGSFHVTYLHSHTPLQVNGSLLPDHLNLTAPLELTGTLRGNEGSLTADVTVHEGGMVDFLHMVSTGTLTIKNGSLLATTMNNTGTMTLTECGVSLATVNNMGKFSFTCGNGSVCNGNYFNNYGTADFPSIWFGIENAGSADIALEPSVAKYSINTDKGASTHLRPGRAKLAELSSLNNAGTFVADGVALFVDTSACLSCHFFLANDAELHLLSANGWRAPRGMLVDNKMSERGTPKICTHDGDCHSDPCPYGSDNASDRCFVNGTIPGVMYHIEHSNMSFCYSCSSSHPFGLVNDVSVLDRLAAATRAHAAQRSWPSTKTIANTLYYFEGGAVESDGSGSLILTSAVKLHGDDALRVKRTRVHALTEHSRPVFVGGGRLTLQKRSELRLGLEAILDDGGSIDARSGSAVIVEHFATVFARNHSLRVAKGAKMRVDGSMRFNKHSSVESCGHSVGAGTLVIDDPAESAHICAEAATCLAECTTDVDCGSGMCSWCTAAHGGDGQGVCVEPGCQTDEDCSLNGVCKGGACTSCDFHGLPFQGRQCNEFPDNSAGSFTVSGSNPKTAEAANTTYSFNVGYYWNSAVVSTIAPPGCPVGGPDDMTVISTWRGTTYEPDHNRVLPRLIMQKTRNLRIFGNHWFFDYTTPQDTCNWTLGLCTQKGLCGAGGSAACSTTAASECGCEPSCDYPPLPPGVCPSYIGSANKWDELGDCGPRDVCYCNRTGEQTVKGTKGCPSNPHIIGVVNSSTEVLLYYNVGDGNSIGLATGPPTGPWTVVKEPVAQGMQDAFVMRNYDGNYHMFATGVKEQNTVHAFSRDGKTWTSSGAALPMTHGGTTFKTRTHPWVTIVPDPYTPHPKGFVTLTVQSAVTTDDKPGLVQQFTQTFQTRWNK